MARLDVVGTWTDGPETFVSGVQDGIAWSVGGDTWLYTAGSGGHGVVAAWDDDGALLDSAPVPQSVRLGADTTLEVASLNGRPALLVSGPAGTGVTVHWIEGDGSLSDAMHLAGSGGTVLGLATINRGADPTLLVASTSDGVGLQIWRLEADDRLTAVTDFTPQGAETAGALVAIDAISIAGQEIVLALNGVTNELIAMALHDLDRLSETGRVGMADGMQIATPTALAVATLDGQTYALVGAAGTSSISVIAIDASGTLTVSDQVNDDLNTRFQSLCELNVVTVDGHVFVLAGGADDGISVLRLLPDGRLLHQATLADTPGTALANVSSLTAVARDGGIDIFATSANEPGITHMTFNPGALGQIIGGSAGADLLSGTGSGDVLSGDAGDDQLSGGGGDDILIDGAGMDTLRGGAGEDVFVLRADGEFDLIADFQLGTDRLDLSDWGRAYSLSAFEMTTTVDGIRIAFGEEVVRLVSGGGTPIAPEQLRLSDLVDLWHIPPTSALDPPMPSTDPERQADEMIHGSSGSETLSGEPTDPAFDPYAAQVFRLYKTVLGRDPDIGGAIGWTNRLVEDLTLTEVAERFTASREFQKRYSAADDKSFVTLLFYNVLDRYPSEAGLANWSRQLEAGAMTRAELVAAFSQTREFVNKTEAEVMAYSRSGLHASVSDEVYRLYRATLGRDPDALGFEHWSAQLAQGLTLDEVAGKFCASREFQIRYGNLDNDAFVTLLYRNVLERDPDPGGHSGWLRKLDTGAMTRPEVVTAFSQSPEFTANTAAEVKSYILSLGPDDKLIGGSGDDLLFGGHLADVFVFNSAQPGADRVADLEPWDIIELVGFDWLEAAAPGELLSLLHQEDDGVHMTIADVSVTFLGTTLQQFSEDMFWVT